MSNNKNLDGNTQSPSEVIEKNKYKNNPIRSSKNSLPSQNENLQKALQKKNVKSGVSTASQALSPVSNEAKADMDADDMDFDGTSSGSQGGEFIAQGVAMVAGLFKNKWLYIIMAGSGVFAFLMLIAIIFLLKNADGLNYAAGTFFANEEYEELYKEVDSVVSSYRSKYGVSIDKYLIISALTAYQDNYMYFDETESGAYDNQVTVEDDDGNGGVITKTIDEMTAKIEILAKYQIITSKSCSFDSSSMRAIASNDDSTTIFNFWTSAAAKEKNYDCNGGSGYKLSTDEGKIDDDNSGSAFYWNLIDENFLAEYYPQYFAGIEEELYYTHAAEAVKYIYLYADALRSLDCNGSNTAGRLTTIYEECSGIKVLADDQGRYAGTYSLEEYVAGVIADEFTPGYMGAVTDDAAAIKEELKAFAIVIRSYSINRTNGCTTTIRNSSYDQNFHPTDDALIWEAVNETAGMVLTNNGTIISAEYDSFYKTGWLCSGSFCTVNYTKKPGGEKHAVSIPISWSNYAAGGHGRGMSQWGSLYLATTGMKYDEIVKTFYSDTVEIQVLSGSGTQTSGGTTAYCSRSGPVAEGEGTCDGSSYYGKKSIGSETMSSSVTMLACTANQAEKAFAEIAAACGKVPHAGAERSLGADVSVQRSATSFHYTGRAIDLNTEKYKGDNRYYYVTFDDTSGNNNSHYYRIYCKVNGDSSSPYAKNMTVTPVIWNSSSSKLVNDTAETGVFLDVTSVLNSYGLYGIGPRSCASEGNYLCTEWWHFQDTSGLVKGNTKFKTTLDQYWGTGYNYSGTPVAEHLNKKWNGGSYS